MSASLLAGDAAANALLASLQKDIQELDPKLVIVQVGEDAASDSYIRKKLQKCQEVGMRNEHMHLPVATTYEEMIDLVAKLNADADVTGYIIQLPLPKHIEKRQPEIFKHMDPKKDVDGFTAYNIGKMFLSPEFEHLPPATPAGIIALLEYYDVNFEGMTAVIVGQSNIVGKPVSVMLKNRGVTTINCDIHTKPKQLKELCSTYGDILISAVGKPGLITGDMIKKDAVIIDVGITPTKDGLKGDVDSEAAMEKAAWVTPVPGGVGPMTVACLLRNCVVAKKRQMER